MTFLELKQAFKEGKLDHLTEDQLLFAKNGTGFWIGKKKDLKLWLDASEKISREIDDKLIWGK